MEASNLLLKIFGDGDDARRTLEQVSREVEDFDKERAEADLEVKSSQAKAEIRALRKELASIDGDTATAEVKARVGEALVGLKLIEREVSRLDRMDATVDVDVRRGALESTVGALTGISKTVGSLVPALGGVAGSMGEVGGAAGKMGGSIGTSGSSLAGVGGPAIAVAAVLGGILLVALTAVAAAATAMAASLGAALIALGALGAAFGGVVLAAGIFGVAVARALKDGGPLAQQLKGAVSKLGDSFQEAASGGVKAFLGDLIPAVKSLAGPVRALKPAFTAFGQAAGSAVRGLATQFAGLVPKFGQLLKASSGALGPLARIVGNVAEVFLNIARAAMPALIDGLRSVADLTGRWAQSTGAVGRVREVIAGLVGHLKSWFNLVTQIADIFVELFQAVAGQGKGIVDTLAQGAGALADWIENNPQVIKKFFQDVIPLAGSFLKTIGLLLVAFLQFTQAVAPALTTLFNILNGALKGLIVAFQTVMGGLQAFGQALLTTGSPLLALANAVVWLVKVLTGNTLSVALQVVTALLSPFAAALNIVKGALGFVAGVVTGLVGALGRLALAVGGGVLSAFNALKVAGTAAFTAMKTVIGGAVRATGAVVKAVWNGAKTAVIAVWNVLKTAATTVWNGIKTVVSAVARTTATVVRSVFNALKGAVVAIWAGIKSATSATWNAVKGAVSKGATAAANVAKSVFNALKGAITGIWNAVKGATSAAWNAIKGAVSKGVNGALNAVKSIASDFVGAGRALIEGLINGIKAMAGQAADAAKSVVKGALDGAKSLLGIGSPSKVFHGIGVNVGEGLVNGLKAMGGAVRGAGTRMAVELGRGVHGARERVEGALRGAFGATATAAAAALARIRDRLAELRGKSGEHANAIRTHLKGMAEAIRDNLADVGKGVRDRISDLQKFGSAMKNVTGEIKKGVAEAAKAYALQKLAGSPDSKELARLKAQGETGGQQLEYAQQDDSLADARAKVADAAQRAQSARAGGFFGLEQQAIQDGAAAAEELRRLERDIGLKRAEDARKARIAELEASLAAKRTEVDQRAKMGTLAEDGDVRRYQNGLNRKLNALLVQLGKGKIGYRQFTEQVNRLLGKVGVSFSPKVSDGKALGKARDEFHRGGRGIMAGLVDGLRAGAGAAQQTVRGILASLRRMLPGSEPKDRSSPLRGLADAGQALMGNVAKGIQGSGAAVASQLSGELAVTRSALAVPAAAPAGGGGVSFGDTNIYPAGGSMDPVDALARLQMELRLRGVRA